MSYLLDALKKAEQERKQSETHSVISEGPSKVTASLPIWVVVALVLVLVLTVSKVLFSQNDTPIVESEPVLAATSVTQDSTAMPSQSSQGLESIETSTRSTQSNEPKELSELDGVTLSRIPSLSLESHIYSSAAEYRSVIINGQSYGEGALLAAGVVLTEITQSGIILKVGEQYVVLPKGISWVSTKHAK